MSQQRAFEQLIRKLNQHAALDAEDEAAIRNLPVSSRLVEPGTYLIAEGDAPTHCLVLITGFAYRQKQTWTGARQILSVHIPGEAIDFQHLFLKVADHSVQVFTRSEVAWTPRELFQNLALTRPNIGRAIAICNAIEAAIFREWIVNVGRRTARERIAHLLCEFASKMAAQGLSDGNSIELPITQEQLADATALTSVHVNRTLRALETDGFITRRGRLIQFEGNALWSLADFDSNYLHFGRQDVGRGAAT